MLGSTLVINATLREIITMTGVTTHHAFTHSGLLP